MTTPDDQQDERQDDEENEQAAQWRSTEGLLTKNDLAKLLGFTESTVADYSTRHPDRLPPRVAWSKTPRWEPRVVAKWKHERDGSVSLDEQIRKAREAVEARQKKQQSDAAERPPRSTGGRPRKHRQ